jgi:hypothetical protein
VTVVLNGAEAGAKAPEHRLKRRHFAQAIGAPRGERQSSLVSSCISHFPGYAPSQYRLEAHRAIATRNGLSALTIMLVSLAPVLLLHGIIAGSREPR